MKEKINLKSWPASEDDDDDVTDGKADAICLETENWTHRYWPTDNIPWQFLCLSILLFRNKENPAMLGDFTPQIHWFYY